jgi:hypothetical protein
MRRSIRHGEADNERFHSSSTDRRASRSRSICRRCGCDDLETSAVSQGVVAIDSSATWRSCSTGSTRPSDHVDDHQPHGAHRARDVSRGRRGPWHVLGSGGTLQNDIPASTSRRRSIIFPPVDARDGSVRLLRQARAEVEHDLIRVTSGRPDRRRCRSWPSRCATASSTKYGLTRTAGEFAPRLSFFFNSHNDFFEETRSARPAAFGPRRCASGWREDLARGAGSTPRPRAAR